jgi:hypothetical protein
LAQKKRDAFFAQAKAIAVFGAPAKSVVFAGEKRAS